MKKYFCIFEGEGKRITKEKMIMQDEEPQVQPKELLIEEEVVLLRKENEEMRRQCEQLQELLEGRSRNAADY